ncbi:MAG: DUF1016 N-terminal domain-containing protein, partial [Oscillospiraceae bacterium]|nr:DUF1016 N-terminal domain-containing protein [Oscillospiraceae bacterium]
MTDTDVNSRTIGARIYQTLPSKNNVKGGLKFVSKELTPKNHAEYGEIISIIERSRENAFRAVNRELISMYWDIGGYVSEKVKHGGWGKAVVEDFARFIQTERPDIKGFSASNVWRMRQ